MGKRSRNSETSAGEQGSVPKILDEKPDVVVGYINFMGNWSQCRDCWVRNGGTVGEDNPHYIATKKGTLVPSGGPINQLICTYCKTNLFKIAQQLNGYRIENNKIVQKAGGWKIVTVAGHTEYQLDTALFPCALVVYWYAGVLVLDGPRVAGWRLAYDDVGRSPLPLERTIFSNRYDAMEAGSKFLRNKPEP